MRDIDNNLSTVIVDLNLTTICANSNQGTIMNHIQNASGTKNYSNLRDKLWKTINKEIDMHSCDIYR